MEVERVDEAGKRKLKSQEEVEALIPAMPMMLIHPVSRQNAPDATPAAQGDSWGVAAVEANKPNGSTGAGIVVAVLDTGIDASHPAFQGMTLVSRNFTGGADNDVTDTDGHGTHCAGTIFGRDVRGRRIGIARGVEKAIIGKVIGEGGGGSEQIVEAVQWAMREGAHVISMSLGIDFPGYIELLVDDGIPRQRAYSMGLSAYRQNVRLFDHLASMVRVSGHPTLLVAAAGNESQRDAAIPYELEVAPPAIAEGFMSVGALGQGPAGLRVADFSNTGAEVAAPGVDILSAAPGGGLAVMSGTSMATPHVAGVAALWGEHLTGLKQLKTLRTRVAGSGNWKHLSPDIDPAHAGSGLVYAP